MTANEFARKQGAIRARRIKSWHGFTCFEAVYGDGLKSPCIGLPQVILNKGGTYRMASQDETLRYMDETKVNDE